MSNCSKYEELISCMIDGELTQAEENELMEHIAQCPSCRSLYKTYKEAFGSFDNVMVEPPAELKENIMAAVLKSGETYAPVNTGAEKATQKKGSSRVCFKYAAIAACFAIVVFSMRAVADRAHEYAADEPGSDSATNDAITDTPAESPASDDFFSDTTGNGSPAGDGGVDGIESDLAEEPVEEPADDIVEPGYDVPEESEPGDIATSSEPGICVIFIYGDLPDILSDADMIDNGDGSFTIYVAPDTAATLMDMGYEYSVPPDQSISEYIVKIWP